MNFDPATPIFPISAPASYAKDLAGKIGLFSTLGMAEEHNGLNNGRLDERAYLAQCELVLEERERLMWFELDRFAEGFFFCSTTFPTAYSTCSGAFETVSIRDMSPIWRETTRLSRGSTTTLRQTTQSSFGQGG